MKKTHSIRTNPARIADLPNDVKASKQLLFKAEEGVRVANEKLAERDTTVTKQKTHIRYLEEIVKLFKANKFGKSSEKSPAQTELFDEAEVEGCDNDQNCLQKQLNLKQHKCLLQVLRKLAVNRSLNIFLASSSNMI
jgi:hypothetical protein